jgi:hypothetical protein
VGAALRQQRNASDEGWKVATDNAGNVIVAGLTTDVMGGVDLLVIKYSGAGVPLWTNRYNGPGNGDDGAQSLAVDGDGNVLVTGHSDARIVPYTELPFTWPIS